MQAVVYLGNRAALEPATGEPLPGKRCTSAHIPEGMSAGEAFTTIVKVWPDHSPEPPAWVAVDGPPKLAAGLTAMLAAHWDCDIRDPDPEA